MRISFLSLTLGCLHGANLSALAADCVAAPTGLVSWWSAESNAMDSVGSNHGVLVGAVSFAPGKVGLGFKLDGSSQHIRVPDSASLDITNEMTMELWYRCDRTFDGDPLFDKRNGGSSCNYGTILSSAYGVEVYYNDPLVSGGDFPGSGFEISALVPPLPAAGVFHHFAATYRQMSPSGVEVKTYVDGLPVRALTMPGLLSRTVNNSPLSIGSEGNGAGAHFKGVIDEVSLYNRALSVAEIQAIALADQSGKCALVVAPSITAQPQNQITTKGGTVTFSVSAAGTQPLQYQWIFNGLAMPDGTNAALTIANVETNQLGSYRVAVMNTAGSVTSSVAMLTLEVPPTCIPPHDGLVAWWPMGGDASDLVGANHATLSGGPVFTAGKVGVALRLDGVNDEVVVAPSATMNVGIGAGFTVEGWVNPSNVIQQQPLIEWNNRHGLVGVHLWLSQSSGQGGGQGCLYANLVDAGNTSHYFTTPGSVVVPNQWQHFALTYSKTNGVAVIYVNGVLRGQASLGSFTPHTTFEMFFGQRVEPSGSSTRFTGAMDEISLYNCALSTVEVQAIHQAGSAGKCLTTQPPSIVAQPQSVVTTVGGSAAIKATAIGSAPLSYLWYFDGAAMTGATNSGLTFSNVQPEQAGAYFVVVANSLGSVTSAVATLTVRPAPTCLPVPSGLVSWWSGESDALDGVGANHGVLVGAVGFAPGKVGLGFKLDGASQHIRVPDSASLDMTSEMTVELWYRSDRTFDGDPLFDKRNGGSSCNYGAILSSAYGVEVYYNDPQVSGGDYPNSGWEISAVPPPLPAAGVFHHFAATYRQADAGNIDVKTYVDGALVRTRSMSGVLARTVNSAPLSIGAEGNGAGAHFQGVIDEVSLYNRALSAAEIEAIFFADQAGKCRDVRPPTILAQPRDVNAFVGGNAAIDVTAVGTLPLGFLWFNDGAPILGATNSFLNWTALEPSQSGSYFVVVSNSAGAITSAPALLVVNPIPTCAPQPGGLVAWWGFEGEINNLVGSDTLKVSGAPQFTAGAVGQALALGGANGYGEAFASTALSVGAHSGISIEAWINPIDASQLADLIEWNNRYGSIGAHFAVSVPNSYGGGPGCLFANLVDIGGVSHQITSVPGLLASGVFQHVALTYDKTSGWAALYLNGAQVALTNLGSFTPQTSYDLFVGVRPSGPISGIRFNGAIDELSLYSRALTGIEIQSVFHAGVSGKCKAARRPTIVSQPQSLVTHLGGTAVFRVVAEGTAPLKYRWFFADAAIGDGTNATLVLASLQAMQAGDYRVVISNSVGSVTSEVATLTVNPIPSCEPPVDGLVAWWSLDGTGGDSVAANDFTLSGDTEFSAAQVGQGLALNGVNDSGRAAASPALDIGRGAGMTIETWLNPANSDQLATVLEWNDGFGTIGTHLAISVANAFGGGPGSIYANLIDTWGVSHQITSGPGVLMSHLWQHLTLTYDKDSGWAALYLNGNPVAVTNLGSFTPQTSYDLFLGVRPSGSVSGTRFVGMIDEISLYGRALSQAEVQAIAGAAGAGKCKTPRAPFITMQPASLTQTEGATAVFGVLAGGTSPLAYQWWVDGNAVLDATNSSLVLSNVHLVNAGSYWVTIVNPVGSVTSSPAILTVEPPSAMPPVITSQPVGVSVTIGENVSLSVVATGAEPLAYQWFWNGSPLLNAAGSTLLLTNVQPSQAGAYSVVVSNVMASVASSAAVVNVNDYQGGTVNFANTLGSSRAFVFDVDGVTKLEGTRYLAQLYAGTNETTLVPIGAATPFQAGPLAGLFFGGTRHISSVPPQGTATVQVRAWDASFAPTFEQALSAGGRVGASLIFTARTGGGMPPMPPPWLLGLESFSLQQSGILLTATNNAIEYSPVLIGPQLVSNIAASPQPAAATAGASGQAPPPQTPGQFRFTIWGEVGVTYVIEKSSDLRNWEPLTTIFNTVGPMQISDPSVGGVPHRFYRARTQH